MTAGNSKKYELLQQIQRNGLLAMATVLARGGGDDSSYFDCVIGNKLTALALQKYADNAPREVIDYIRTQQVAEQCYCKIFRADKSELAEKDCFVSFKGYRGKQLAVIFILHALAWGAYGDPNCFLPKEHGASR